MFFNVPAPPDISQTCPTRSLQDALPTSAYALRIRRDGAAFRLGWDAAILIARARLADDLLARALTGHEEVIRKDMDAGEITRHRHDNRLAMRSEEHTSELQSLMRNSYAVFCLKKKKHNNTNTKQT